MTKIAIVGDRETVFPFQAVGFDIVIADASDIKDKFRDILTSDKAVIFITEDLAIHVEKELEVSMKKPFPIVTLIPSISQEQGSREDILRLIEKIVGPNIMKEE